MDTLTHRIEPKLQRPTRPTSGKIIFISCEGQVTEEEYFKIVSNLFSNVKSKIQFVSVMEDILSIPAKFRTADQISELGKNKPWQLLEKIERFKEEKKDVYDFDKHPEDEFWIVSDVDENTNSVYVSKWNETLSNCDAKKYGYAISNPYFELWLLLHHVDAIADDHKYAVTDASPYDPTSHAHFGKRLLDDASAPRVSKHINAQHYDINKIKCAISRAKNLHNINESTWPKSLGSTAYLLLEKIIEVSDSYNNR